MLFKPFNFSSPHLTPRQIRRMGWLLIVIGLFLVALMGLVGAMLLELISLTDLIPGTYRDESAGPVEVSVGAYVFFGFSLLFGFVTVAMGAYQVFTGKRSRKLILTILVMAAIFMIAGLIASGLE
jgi:hypothetical protein